MSIKATATQPNQHNSSPQPNIAKYILENKPQLTDDGNDSGNKQWYSVAAMLNKYL